MKILVTGSSGFIGFHVCKSLNKRGHEVVGLDNINDYYDVNLKFARLKELGISKEDATDFNQKKESESLKDFSFIRIHLEDRKTLDELFKKESFDVVCHLAAQAGVRYSLENPDAYISSNIVGFLNILENCRHNRVKHLVYASSSSVYGNSKNVPFETSERVDRPVSLYAATKISNELMAHTYSHLYGFPTTGLRFFTVYGPWGRPDMAYFLFTNAILRGKSIKVFNQGNLERDFTFIDDIVEGIVRIIEKPLDKRLEKENLYKVYNIGNNQSVKLTDFIHTIEKTLGKTANKILSPMQAGDVEKTWANVDDLINDYDYRPQTSLKEGIKAFVDWYQSYMNSD
ncbi:NAD-dependent epimerase [Robiginitalea aurantiaca]|uniref:NAD-dependent epimerase n=1 Tax=Robiginitalea aurantiaca TaxID=3056915 RepID=A0ABT7WIP5_9FLAO|nr:NAD-dependent epimerase [Robiginitalea aurantiaca]MDM9632804.1 NAD-dependent epimerase [Robiginitalea aurantiaca]